MRKLLLSLLLPAFLLSAGPAHTRPDYDACFKAVKNVAEAGVKTLDSVKDLVDDPACAAHTEDPSYWTLVTALVALEAGGTFTGAAQCKKLPDEAANTIIAELFSKLPVISGDLKDELQSIAQGESSRSLRSIPALKPIFATYNCACNFTQLRHDAREVADKLMKGADETKNCGKFLTGLVESIGQGAVVAAWEGAKEAAEEAGEAWDLFLDTVKAPQKVLIEDVLGLGEDAKKPTPEQIYRFFYGAHVRRLCHEPRIQHTDLAALVKPLDDVCARHTRVCGFSACFDTCASHHQRFYKECKAERGVARQERRELIKSFRNTFYTDFFVPRVRSRCMHFALSKAQIRERARNASAACQRLKVDRDTCNALAGLPSPRQGADMGSFLADCRRAAVPIGHILNPIIFSKCVETGTRRRRCSN